MEFFWETCWQLPKKGDNGIRDNDTGGTEMKGVKFHKEIEKRLTQMVADDLHYYGEETTESELAQEAIIRWLNGQYDQHQGHVLLDDSHII